MGEGRVLPAMPRLIRRGNRRNRVPTARPWRAVACFLLVPQRTPSVWCPPCGALRAMPSAEAPFCCISLPRSCLVGTSRLHKTFRSGRAEGALHSPAHGNAVGERCHMDFSPARASQTSPYHGYRSRFATPFSAGPTREAVYGLPVRSALFFSHTYSPTCSPNRTPSSQEKR